MSNELTDVRCSCGDEYPADSYDAGFIAGSGMCQNCDAALPPKDICTCPSGNGSLRHPCPAHPAVEQAGGDERAAFELFVRKHCGMPAHIAVNWDAKFTNDAWAGWQARAALAQPSPALPPFAEKVLAKLRRFYDCASDFESGGVDIGRHWFDLLTQLGLLNRVQRSPAFWEISQQGEDLLGMPQPSPAQAEQAEAERPEVVAYRTIGRHEKHQHPHYALNYYKQNAEDQAAHWRERGCEVSEDELMTVAQHDRIVGALRAEIAQLRQHKNDYMDAGQETYRALQNEIREREAEIARLDGLVSGRTAERDAALARVAELERGKVYVEARQCDECQHGGINDSATGVAACHECDWTGPEPEEDRCPGCQRENCMAAACPQCGARYVLVASEEIAAPVAQAQQLNDLDKQCRDDVARALGLRPNQERGFAWSYLLASIKSCVKASGDSAQAQHSVPIAHEFKRALGLVVAALEADGDRPTSKYALSELKKVLAAAPGTEVPQAWLDVQAERRRQITAEGWTPDHDDLYCAAELPRAAAAYILSGANDEAPAIWPFSAKWWKPRDARANYMRAGALILAEIERLDRAAERGKEVGHE